MAESSGKIVVGALCLAILSRGSALRASEPDSADTGADGLSRYFKQADRTQDEQPHWITPLVTTTPRLTQRVRYDLVWQSRSKAVNFTNYGSNKGVEIIPAESISVTLGIPAYETLTGPKSSKDGWADETFQVKYRAVSANEEHGNFIVTAFFGVSIPTGSSSFTSNRTVYTPTIAAGKGWGTRKEGFNIQSTLAVSIPSGNKATIGVPTVWNTVLQAHVLDEHVWPEAELNYTHWSDGPNDGKAQKILTAGVVAGRFPISGRLHVVVGAGYQWAISSFRAYNHAWVVSIRTPF